MRKDQDRCEVCGRSACLSEACKMCGGSTTLDNLVDENTRLRKDLSAQKDQVAWLKDLVEHTTDISDKLADLVEFLDLKPEDRPKWKKTT